MKTVKTTLPLPSDFISTRLLVIGITNKLSKSPLKLQGVTVGRKTVRLNETIILKPNRKFGWTGKKVK